ncbi:MAG TPA: RnfABCDGE type electron transport complex subunit B [Sphaerochaeta sp.]|nr:RnfABCDGE type electron transport complex subunit B [Spirochaetota bacterium]NLV61553.1 RnfABCDGE type electron transport complex subunit B [Spirochaetales bacterium]HOE83607.1 RnfABCDGE type electron transport complex subunit B [Sphaerochaeta sp.]HOQ93785.1 RnfABCDGE type electron transport complex subunit B [Sphaerochaeta sp.]HPK46512.1 RnfABCDGE type electron transport complex subunit B [Sphaerochaeta sp.]
MEILLALVTVALLGGIFGFGLSYAEKKLAIKKDEKLLELEPIMPGVNCGVCGYAGCNAYASAIAKDGAPLNLCAPGGAALTQTISRIMGMVVEDSGQQRRLVAHVMCKGNVEFTAKDYRYDGPMDCNAAALLLGGENTCKDGCLKMGSCIKVCPTDAISLDSDGYIVVDEAKCISCEKCVAICPTHVMQMIYEDSEYSIDCNSKLPGGQVRKFCSVGCIGCKICENKFPESGCKVEDYLAHFDQAVEHAQIAEAAEACPTKIIRKR